mgnify:CR=1 FL=1
MKIKAKDLPEKERILVLDALYTAAGTVRGRAAMKVFLRDLLTESERIMMGRRILIARELLAGKKYDEIVESLKVGRATVRKVERWLHDQFPGYENAIKDMEKEFKARRPRGSTLAPRNSRNFDSYLYATSALYRLKKKYPLHFLLFPTPKRRP